jgi:hypothetical protein
MVKHAWVRGKKLFVRPSQGRQETRCCGVIKKYKAERRKPLAKAS